jgi:hypothetical protein
MGDLGLFLDVVALLITLAVIATLRWAAIERARSHRLWLHGQDKTHRTRVDWYVVLGVTMGWA